MSLQYLPLHLKNKKCFKQICTMLKAPCYVLKILPKLENTVRLSKMNKWAKILQLLNGCLCDFISPVFTC